MEGMTPGMGFKPLLRPRWPFFTEAGASPLFSPPPEKPNPANALLFEGNVSISFPLRLLPQDIWRRKWVRDVKCLHFLIFLWIVTLEQRVPEALLTKGCEACLAPAAGRWRSVPTQPPGEPRHRAGLCCPNRKPLLPVRARGKPSILCISRREAFLFGFTSHSLEMWLETPSATELITMAFYSLTKCFPRIPAQLRFVSPQSWYSGWMQEKQSSKVRCPLSLPERFLLFSRTKWNEWPCYPHIYLLCVCLYVYILHKHLLLSKEEKYINE